MTNLDVGGGAETPELSVQRRLDDILRSAYRVTGGDLEQTKSKFRDRMRYHDDAAELLWGFFSQSYDRVFGPRFAKIAKEVNSENARPGRSNGGSSNPRPSQPRPATATQPTAEDDEEEVEPVAPSMAAHREIHHNFYLNHVENFQIQLYASKPKLLLECTVRELRAYQRQSMHLSTFIEHLCSGLQDDMVPGRVLARADLEKLAHRYATEEIA